MWQQIQNWSIKYFAFRKYLCRTLGNCCRLYGKHWATLAMTNFSKELPQNTTVIQSEHTEQHSKSSNDSARGRRPRRPKYLQTDEWVWTFLTWLGSSSWQRDLWRPPSPHKEARWARGQAERREHFSMSKHNKSHLLLLLLLFADVWIFLDASLASLAPTPVSPLVHR